MSTDGGVYRELLLDHFHHPRNRGEVAGMMRVRRGANPRCGDEVEVGIDLDGECLRAVRFRGRGCSICIASASMMSEVLSGTTVDEAMSLSLAMTGWFSGAAGSRPPTRISEPLAALSAVQGHPARRRCALLAWEALMAALRDKS